jgi:hypothetical protein
MKKNSTTAAAAKDHLHSSRIRRVLVRAGSGAGKIIDVPIQLQPRISPKRIHTNRFQNEHRRKYPENRVSNLIKPVALVARQVIRCTTVIERIDTPCHWIGMLRPIRMIIISDIDPPHASRERNQEKYVLDSFPHSYEACFWGHGSFSFRHSQFPKGRTLLPSIVVLRHCRRHANRHPAALGAVFGRTTG